MASASPIVWALVISSWCFLSTNSPATAGAQIFVSRVSRTRNKEGVEGMKRILICCALLSVCFQSHGLAQQRIADIKDVDPRRVLNELKKLDTGGMFRQGGEARPVIPRSGPRSGEAKKRTTAETRRTYEAGPIIPRSGEAKRVPVTTEDKSMPYEAGPMITLKPQGQAAKQAAKVEERQEGEFFKLLVPVPEPQPKQSTRIERAPASQPRMVRYFLEQEQKPYIPDPYFYLEDGSISRVFYKNIEHHPLMIEVKLKPNEAISYYPRDGEKISFARIEDVPLDGILYYWNGRQVFLKFGTICGLDGGKEVALAYRSRQLEVIVKRAKIVPIPPNTIKSK